MSILSSTRSSYRGVRSSLLLQGLSVLLPLALLASSFIGSTRWWIPRANAASGPSIGVGSEHATIYRDSYGVPHIYAEQTPGIWFGAGYAQAQDRLVQLELVRRAFEGTLSAIFGSSELSMDQTTRTFFYTPAEVRAQYNSLPLPYRQALQAYADGINAYIAQAYANPESEVTMVPYEFWTLGLLVGLQQGFPYRPANWTPTDTVAIGDFLARSFGSGGGNELDNLSFLQYLQAELARRGDIHASSDAFAIFNDGRWINDPTAPTTVPGATAAAPASLQNERTVLPNYLQALSLQDVQTAAQALGHDQETIERTGQRLKVPWRDGSNAFVIAPSRSRDGHALLWGGPQEGFVTPSIDGEEYLHGPNYEAGGMYVIGEPFILIGLNQNLAWTITREELVNQQVYIEQQVNFNASPPTYLYKGQQVPMQVIHETIDVAHQGPQDFVVYRTVHGPVFSLDKAAHRAFSMRIASWDNEMATLTGFAEMGDDASLPQFQRSVSKITTIDNVFYADRQGNIAYFGTGLLPILPSCTTCDPRLPHLGDGSQEWQGFVPFDQMPHSINPSQGFIVNWNTKPDQQHFYQQNRNDEYWGTIYRSNRIAQLIQQESKLSLTDATNIERDIGTIDGEDVMRPAAPYFLPFLNTAYQRLVQAHDPLVDPATYPDLSPALAALKHWDLHTALGSPAMSIFVEFMEALKRNLFGGGVNTGEEYTGAINFNDGSLNAGTFLDDATYNLEYHILAGTQGIIPCNTLCYENDYFHGNRDHILVESLNDAIALLSGTGPILGNGKANGFGTTNINAWGWVPYADINWDNLNPLAFGVITHYGSSPSQERSTYMQAIDLAPHVFGVNVLPPGQSGFIGLGGQPSPHFGDQVSLFNQFGYKPISLDFPRGG